MSRKSKERAAREARRFKPYPAYKDSSVDWLGEIPKHWEAKRLRHAAGKIGSGKTPSGGAEVYLSEGVMLLRSQNVHFGGLRLDDVAFIDSQTDSEMAGSRVREGDVLLNITGASLGRCCVARLNGVAANVNQHVCIIRPQEGAFESAFLAAGLASQPVQAQIFTTENGISRDALNFEQIGQLRIARPAPAEQSAIAAFLDQETARIDALVAKKERLIELLQEKRTALTTRAVTKGLDPNAPMKDSGVEWVGKIPAHWEVKKVKRLCLVRRGASPRPIDDPTYFDEDGEYAWVRIADVTASKRYLEQTTQRLSTLGKSKSVPLEPGELFVSIAATVGKPVITKIKCCIHDGFVYFVGLHENREFLFYLFSCGEPYKGLGKLGTQLNLNTDTIGDIYLPRPPGDEQEALVQFLDRENARVDALVAKVHDAIERLRELRIALISAAVTGKIDVREEAI